MNRKNARVKKNPPKTKVAKAAKKKTAVAKELHFEDCIDIIDTEITKRKNKWNLTALAWMDFDDVSQILRIHIFRKWHLYDQTKKLTPWINRIISNQIKNLIRKGKKEGYILNKDLNDLINLLSVTDKNYIKNTIENMLVNNFDKLDAGALVENYVKDSV